MVLIIGVALAGGAVYLAQGYIEEYRTALDEERATNIDLTQIAVARKSLEYGDIITPDMVAFVRWPVQAVPDGAFATKKEFFSKGEDELRVALRPIVRGEPVLTDKISEPGEGAGLVSLLEPGMRAFTIRVDVQTGVSGFLRPGDRVDVFWTGNAPDPETGKERNTTMLIETAVELIAVDQSAETTLVGANVAGTVTAQVTPQTVARLAQAQNSGRLSLALVGSRDVAVASAVDYGIDIDRDTLLGIRRPEVVEAEPVVEEETCSIRTRRGAEVVEIPIPCAE
ncbi:MAG: Flp pilus assembly protein CpaB [Pseudomonadota bacterium]